MGCTSSSEGGESKGKKGGDTPIEMKVVMLGNGGVGKSAITFRFVQQKFVESYNPTIEDSYRKQMKVDGRSVILDILDTAGQEEYTELREVYMRGGEGFVIVYSIIDKKSFMEVNEFRERILRVKDTDSVPMLLVGNKCDLESQRVVAKSEAEAFAQKLGVPFLETSAFTGQNAEDVFNVISREIIKRRK